MVTGALCFGAASLGCADDGKTPDGGAGGTAGSAMGGAGANTGGGQGGSVAATLLGGCPSGNDCSPSPPGSGETCPVEATCCEYQSGQVIVKCLCTGGEWVCPSQCACP